MSTWLPAALLSLLSFGFWGFSTKLSMLYIDSRSALIYQTVGVAIVGVITLSLMNFKPATDFKGLGFAILTGACYAVGCFFYFVAADKGKINTVVTLTALYPFITIALGYWFLKESISGRQCLGIVLAFVAIVLMSV